MTDRPSITSASSGSVNGPCKQISSDSYEASSNYYSQSADSQNADSQNSMKSGASENGSGKGSLMGSFRTAIRRISWRKSNPPITPVGQPTVSSPLRVEFAGKAWSFSDFDVEKTIGMGAYGRVRVAKVKGDSKPFVLKIMKKAEIIRTEQVAHILDEKRIMMMLEHPFIVNLYAAFQDERRLFMLEEFVNGGELFAYLQVEGKLPNDQSRFYGAQIVSVFSYLHSWNIVYRDLKPENCLFDAEGYIKVTDFGLSKIVTDKTYTVCGTPDYLAPEMLKKEGYGKGVDWWALGVLIYEMLVGYRPFDAPSPTEIYQKILSGDVNLPKDVDAKAKDLLKRLLEGNSSRRYGCGKRGVDDIKKHKWFKGLSWENLAQRSIAEGVPYVPRVKGEDDTTRFDRYPESSEEPALPSEVDQQKFRSYDTGPSAVQGNGEGYP